ncbi:MAG: hypothetical protein NTX50_08670 [Candidatus Sumerlaeota bacterium]|nr:hypothetical protein [Candidatus Sumerlaeota bacterium]
MLAALYVALKPNATESEKKERGKVAAAIFWIIFAVIGFIAILALEPLSQFIAPEKSKFPFYYSTTLQLLVPEFFVCFWIANQSLKKCRLCATKRSRVLTAAFFFMLWFFADAFALNATLSILMAGDAFESFRPVNSTLMFMACWIGAHFWREFQDRPSFRSAWKFAGAFLITCVLFQGIAQFATLGHYYAYRATRGKIPTTVEAQPYKTQ